MKLLVSRWLTIARLFIAGLFEGRHGLVLRSVLIGILAWAIGVGGNFIGHVARDLPYGVHADEVMLGIFAGTLHWHIQRRRAVLGELHKLRDLILTGKLRTMEQMQEIVREVLLKHGFKS